MMRLGRMFVMLGFVASLGIGLITAGPANATVHRATALTVRGSHRSHRHVNGLLREKSVDVKTADHGGTYCAEFKGELEYYEYVGKEPLYQFTVTGTLYARCGGTAHLRMYWTPADLSEQSKLIGNTTSTERIGGKNAESPQYVGGISNMHVEVCSFNAPVGGCANSPDV